MSFSYKQRFSRSREEYIISYLEKQEISKVLQTRALFDAILAVLAPKADFATNAVDSIKSYTQLTLPSAQQKGKIEDINKIDKEELSHIKDLLARKKKERFKKE